MTEVEVLRISVFAKDKCYAFAMKTRRSGEYPNERYYTTNMPQFLGKHVRAERWGFCDGSGGADTFVDDAGKKTRIEYDYEGNTCFTEVPDKKITESI